ncbi:alpha/beta hydrolase [soil metagenome]
MDDPAPRTEKSIDVGTGKLVLELAGHGDDVLLVHSGISDCRMWDGQFDVLAGRFRVTRYDLRGFGRSSAVDREYSHVDDLLQVIAALDLNTPRVVAASMGARVAIDAALRSPGRFGRLLLIGPAISGRGFEDPTLRACWDAMSAAWDAGDVEKMIDIETRFWINGPTRIDGSVDESVLERVREMQRRIVELQPDEDLEVAADPPAASRLEQLAMPVLVIVGEHDVSDIHRNARSIVDAAADTRIVIVPGTGHLPNMEEPDAFNELVLEFLTTVAV